MKILNILKNIYYKEEFNPRFIGLFLPDYFITKALHHNMLNLTPKLYGRLLDIGCGTKPYQKMCTNVSEYIGIEIDDSYPLEKKFADYTYDGKSMPFSNKSFDCALSVEVIEHVFNPDIFFKEINRVLKTDGLFLMSTPFLYKEHGQPFDYARYSSFGLKHILNENGFSVVKEIKTGNGPEVVSLTMTNYLLKAFKFKFPFNIFTFFLFFTINFIGLIFSKILPRNNDLYMENIILAQKVKDLD